MGVGVRLRCRALDVGESLSASQGVDDSFLIRRTLEEEDDAEGPGTEERIAKALAKAL